MTIKISVELSSEDIEAICANYNVDSLDPINIDCVEARQQEFSQALRELMVSHVFDVLVNSEDGKCYQYLVDVFDPFVAPTQCNVDLH